MQPVTAAVVDILRMSDTAMSIEDILQRAQQDLGRSINRASLKAALSEMASSESSPVRRASRGRYETASATATGAEPCWPTDAHDAAAPGC